MSLYVWLSYPPLPWNNRITKSWPKIISSIINGILNSSSAKENKAQSKLITKEISIITSKALLLNLRGYFKSKSTMYRLTKFQSIMFASLLNCISLCLMSGPNCHLTLILLLVLLGF